jgi:predicted ATPase
VLGGDIITTVPGRGYHFTLPVEQTAVQGAAPRLVASSALPPLRTNLPERPAPLVGRDEELAALHLLLDQHRLVTVLGAAGMGKTRLAQSALHARRGRYQHEVCFVDLATLPPGDDIVGLVAATLGLAQPGGADPVAGLVKALSRLDLLLALDKAEHVLGGVAALAAALGHGAPGVQLLVTSQAPLRVAQEWIYRLDQRLSLLTGGRRDAPARQQTLRAALQWSHELLVAHEQAVFRRLSVFAGGASLAMALRVVAGGAPGGLDEWAALDALARQVAPAGSAGRPGRAQTQFSRPVQATSAARQPAPRRGWARRPLSGLPCAVGVPAQPAPAGQRS